MYHHTRNRLLTRVAAPAGEVLTMAEAKLYLRIDGNHEDTLIGDLIVTARMIAEEWLKASLMTQSWMIAYDGYWPFWRQTRRQERDVIRLPMGPVNSVASVTAVAQDGTTQLIDSSLYFLSAARDELVLTVGIFPFRMEIVYRAGYGDAGSVPRPVRQGMLAHIAAMYEGRGDDTGMPEQAVQFYTPYREVRL